MPDAPQPMDPRGKQFDSMGNVVGEKPPRQLNDLGLYSRAAEIAANLKQPKGSPQQLINMVKNMGAKPMELEHAKPEEAFAGRPTITREELADHFAKNLAPVERVNLGTEYGTSEHSTTGELRKNYGVTGLVQHPPEGAPVLEENPEYKNHKAFASSHYDEYMRAPTGSIAEKEANRKYLYHKEVVANLEKEHYKKYGEPFTDSHWPSVPNIIAHYRTSEWQKQPPGEKPYKPRVPPPHGTAEITTRNGTQAVASWDPGTQGLVVHKDIDFPSKYVLTHLRSGMAVKRGMTFHHAMDLGKRVANVTDWTQDKYSLMNGITEPHPDFEHLTRRQVLQKHFDQDVPPPQRKRPLKKVVEQEKPENVLLMDELQSDWGQKYRDDMAPEEHKTVPKGIYTRTTEPWTSLSLKTLLHSAANSSHDRLAWTPGEKQAERWRQRKKVTGLFYEPDDHIAHFFDGAHRVIRKTIPPDHLRKMLGDERANMLFNSPRLSNTHQRITSRGLPFGTYHHVQFPSMKVGGEGMMHFYDNIVPKELMKLVKKHDPSVNIEPVNAPGMPIHGFPSIKLTKKLKMSIGKYGFEAYKRGGIVGRALSICGGA